MSWVSKPRKILCRITLHVSIRVHVVPRSAVRWRRGGQYGVDFAAVASWRRCMVASIIGSTLGYALLPEEDAAGRICEDLEFGPAGGR